MNAASARSADGVSALGRSRTSRASGPCASAVSRPGSRPEPSARRQRAGSQPGYPCRVLDTTFRGAQLQWCEPDVVRPKTHLCILTPHPICSNMRNSVHDALPHGTVSATSTLLRQAKQHARPNCTGHTRWTLLSSAAATERALHLGRPQAEQLPPQQRRARGHDRAVQLHALARHNERKVRRAGHLRGPAAHATGALMMCWAPSWAGVSIARARCHNCSLPRHRACQGAVTADPHFAPTDAARVTTNALHTQVPRAQSRSQQRGRTPEGFP